MDSLLQDVRYTLRQLGRARGFTIVALLTLAIGIGATTAVFTVVDGVLLKPLAYANPDELVALTHDAPGAPGLAAAAGTLQMSVSMLVTYREHNRSFASLGLWSATGANITGLAEPENLGAAFVTGDLFPTLGVPPLLGRWITLEDEAPGRPAVIVLSYAYWQRRFGGDADVIGRTVTMNSMPAEIVGVMPEGFMLGTFDAALFGVTTIDRSRLIPPPFCCNGVARLKPGVTLEQASADVARMLPTWLETFPLRGDQSGRALYLDTWRVSPALKPLKTDVVGNAGQVLWTVLGTIAVVLLIACANVTNLLLVRGEQRARELAVRAALGAGRLRLSRALLLESMLLALGGGVLGVGVALAALKLLIGFAPPLPRLGSIALDWRSIAFTLAVTAVAGGLLGLAPALRAARGTLSTALRGGGARGASAGREQHRVQNTLVVGQVALTLVLLVGSGLMLRTFAALQAVDPGFADPATLQVVRIGWAPALVPEARDVLAQQRAVVAAVEALPGVESAAFANGVPMQNVGRNWSNIEVEGRPAGGDALRMFRLISPGFLEVMGTPLVAGRSFEWLDLEDTRPVALVSENLARELWGTAEGALGQRIRTGQGAWFEVVGVAADVRNDSVAEAPPTIVYWPTMTAFNPGQLFVERFVALAVRTERAGTAALARELERAVWSVNSSVPLSLMQRMQDVYDRSLARTSFALVMLGVAGTAALALGVVGLYGVLSYTVSQRRREIAIRLALGAQQRAVTQSFVRHGLALCGIGVSIGLLSAAALTGFMTSLLYEVRAVDPLTYAAVALLITLAAVLACWLPARRAASVDPAEALAAE